MSPTHPTESATRPIPPTTTSTTATAATTALPTRRTFDPWNSSSTGHQRADNRLAGSTSWRDSRALKLGVQFRGGLSGGVRVADTVGEGSENFGRDGRTDNGGWVRGASGLRERAQRSIAEALGAKTGKVGVVVGGTGKRDKDRSMEKTVERGEGLESAVRVEEYKEGAKKQVFQGVCIFINGSTAPYISDHKLKHLLAEHGARVSISLGRRSVTHVILGNTSRSGGAGGGLAGGKIQKEIARVGGKGIKFVSVEWWVTLLAASGLTWCCSSQTFHTNMYGRVIESIKAGKRLQEARFSNVKVVAKGQRSVLGMFKTEGNTSTNG